MRPDGHPQLMSPFCVFISAAKLTTEVPAATAARHEAGASGGGGGSKQQAAAAAAQVVSPK